MRLRMSVVRADEPAPPVEIEVEAPAEATAGDLAAELAALLDLPVSPGRPRLAAAGQTVDPDLPVGRGPLVDGAAVTIGGPARSRRPAPRQARSAVCLAVVGGPDAGRRFDLPPGTHRIGRSTDTDLTVADTEISRVHAELSVGPEGVWLHDCRSTNGTQVNGIPLPETGAAVDSGCLITLGHSRFRLRTPFTRPASVSPSESGLLSVNRAPRIRHDPGSVTIGLPSPPEPPTASGLPWLAMLLPLPICGVLAVFFGPQVLAFALMGPVLMMGHTLGERINGKRRYAVRLREHEARLRESRGRVEAAVAAEQRQRRLALPDAEEVLAIATTPSSRLWERRPGDPDMLDVRIGTGTAASTVRVLDPARGSEPTHPEIAEVPCAVPLGAAGVVGIAGPRESVVAVVTSVIGQVATLHSPLDVELWLLGSEVAGSVAWQWISRLPHNRDDAPNGQRNRAAFLDSDPAQVARAVAELRRVVDERLGAVAASGSWTGERTVVVLDGAERLRSVPGLAPLLADGPRAGVVFVAIEETAGRLPVEARTTLELGPGPAGTRLRSSDGGTVRNLVVDRVGPWWGDRLSRALAPLRDATPRESARRAPDSARLLDLLDYDALDPAELVTRWEQHPRATSVIVGASAGGRHLLDLRTDGPHVLVGGTTGSGKSEFLQTLISSLALANRPDQLSFVLIDYKGGSAFKECAGLPHTAGLVTDLDGHLTERALASLTAELKRRERLLATLGAKDVDDFNRATSGPALPRLVIVIDEFRMLAEELPAFIDGMVRIAALGRSLGVHLVLATQRPAGVVSSDIKANVNLRIALRVRDRADSEDVIDAPDAADISERTPGRALARSGSRGLATFQTARVGGPAPEAKDASLRVSRLDWTRPGDASPAVPTMSPEAPHGPTELSAIVEAIRAAAARSRCTPSPSPWVPPLPERVDVSDLPASSVPAVTGSLAIPLGLADHPADQCQAPLEWRLADPGHWGVAGASGTGKSSLLRSAAWQVAQRFTPEQVHLYAVDSPSGGLRGLEALPHTGAVVSRDELPRLHRLVSRLSREVTRRQEDQAHGGAESPPPVMLLMIDDWNQLAQALDPVDHGALTDQLLALFHEGQSVGLRVVLTGDRGLLFGRPASLLDHKLVLRLADPADAAMAGLPRSALPVNQPPGRAVLVEDGSEVQLATFLSPQGAEGDPAHLVRLRAAGAEARQRSGDPGPGREPLRVEAMPTLVEARSLLDGLPRADGLLPVGLGGDELEPIGVSPATDGRLVLVAGASRSGKSTALLAFASGLVASGHPVAVVSARQGPLDALRSHSGVVAWASPAQPEQLIEARRARPDLAVLVDDADRLLDTPIEPVLREIAHLVDADQGMVVCAANSSALSAQFRGVAIEVARHQTGILLSPSGISDADLFGIRIHRGQQRIPGRGLLVVRLVATDIQVADGARGDALPSPEVTRAAIG